MTPTNKRTIVQQLVNGAMKTQPLTRIQLNDREG